MFLPAVQAALVGAVLGALVTGLVTVGLDLWRAQRKADREREQRRQRLLVHLQMVQDRCLALLRVDEEADELPELDEQPKPPPDGDPKGGRHARTRQTLELILGLPYFSEERWLDDASSLWQREQLRDLTDELFEAVACAAHLEASGRELGTNLGQEPTLRHLKESITIARRILYELLAETPGSWTRFQLPLGFGAVALMLGVAIYSLTAFARSTTADAAEARRALELRLKQVESSIAEPEASASDTGRVAEELRDLTQVVKELKLEPEIDLDASPLVRALEDIRDRVPRTSPTSQPLAEITNIIWALSFLALLVFLWQLHATKDERLSRLKRAFKYVTLGLGVVSALAICLMNVIKLWSAYKDSGEQAQIVSLVPIPTKPVTLPMPILQLGLLGEGLTAFVIPFQEEAGCEAGEPRRGVELAAEFEGFLEWFGKQVATCASERGPSVVLRVRGFASSSELDAERLRECEVESSAAANLKFAEARRQSVEDILRAACGAGCTFKDGSWQGDYDTMVNERRFNDRRLGRYVVERGSLNRRAEVIIESGGDCESLEHALSRG